MVTFLTCFLNHSAISSIATLLLATLSVNYSSTLFDAVMVRMVFDYRIHVGGSLRKYVGV